MAINRRRAPSSATSSEKKKSGHRSEDEYATLIGGRTLSGTQKSDVIDRYETFHSVKSQKKWQIFLYGYERISKSSHLNILKPCLDSFNSDAELYFQDREKCIEFKEDYIKKYGREKAKELQNLDVKKNMTNNSYIESKEKLSLATENVCKKLQDKSYLEDFLQEAIFNSNEVQYLAIRDDTFAKDGRFKVFSRKDVIDTLTKRLSPSTSKAGLVPEDYNVAKQKTLLCYKKLDGKDKNIIEIEIRNDSDTHYRQVRFNMYSKDTLSILIEELGESSIRIFNNRVWFYGSAAKELSNY